MHVQAREVCFLIGPDDAVVWSDASDSPVALPDSRARWEAIWSRREVLVEVAHTHPIGPSRFSQEDETTMAALTSALGRPLVFSVVTATGMVRRGVDGHDAPVDDEPWWTELLRTVSYINPEPPPGGAGMTKAILNITYSGLSVDVPGELDYRTSDFDLKRIAVEVIRSGDLRGLQVANLSETAFRHFVVDRFDTPEGGKRIYLRPKVPFGTAE